MSFGRLKDRLPEKNRPDPDVDPDIGDLPQQDYSSLPPEVLKELAKASAIPDGVDPVTGKRDKRKRLRSNEAHQGGQS